MTQQLSERLSKLAPSATLAMSQKSSELKAQGIDIINMAVGEPDFNTPEHIKNAAKKAIDENWSRYSPITGYLDLRQAICDKLLRENGLSYKPSQIVVGTGAKQGLTNTVLALVNPGDEVIIPAPYWVSYPQMARLAGGVPVFIETDIKSDFKITPSQLESAITPRTKLVFLNTPSNPTGSIYSESELAALADVIVRHDDIFVLSDEIYEHINYTGKNLVSIAAFPGMSERTIVVNGVSKAYAMTGWRIGFTACAEWLAKGLNTLQGQYTSNTCSIAQRAALEAWTADQGCITQMREAFRRRRDLIVELTAAIPGLEVNNPMGAFYLFPKCSSYFGKSFQGKKILSSTDLSLYLLEQGHVATVAGDAFGLPDYFRMSYATSDDNIREAIRRIADALSQLR